LEFFCNGLGKARMTPLTECQKVRIPSDTVTEMVQTDRHTDRQTDRPADGRTDRHTGRQT